MTPQEFLDKAYKAAVDSGHIFPEFAACEAALESAWGNSKLCILGNNLFGQKAPRKNSAWPTIDMKTKENADLNHDGIVAPDETETIVSKWIKFPDWASAFRERMAVLQRLAPDIRNYRNALAAKTGREFVTEVSKSWSTDPLRATKVLIIYDRHFPA